MPRLAAPLVATSLDTSSSPSSITYMKNKESRGWLARLGVAGFCFFLVKGLAWLVVPLLVVNWSGCNPG
jgi:hypothetical protein